MGVVHQAGTHAALLGNLDAILVAELVDLLHQLLHLLHDGLVLLLILLLGGIGLLLRLLVSGREVGYLLLLLRRLLVLRPRIGDVVSANAAASTALLSLSCGFFQLFLKFVK